MLLKDRVALITGATGALGRTVARAFLEEGARLALTYREEPRLEELLSFLGRPEGRVLPLKADVAQEADVKEAVARAGASLGRIDVLVNVVGGYWGGVPVAQTSLEDWNRMLDINLKPCFLCCRAALPSMVERKWGRIINVASRAGLKGAAKAAAYSVAKAGVIILTEALAEELKNDGITVNAVLPSTIDTPANRQAMPRADTSRWVPPEDIARLIVFLASDQAGNITGASIPIYGRA